MNCNYHFQFTLEEMERVAEAIRGTDPPLSDKILRQIRAHRDRHIHEADVDRFSFTGI